MKILRNTIAICLVLVMMLTPVAGADELQINEQTIKLLGIMNGDQNGNMNYSGLVTREQFAKMTIMASQYKDLVAEGSNVSVFKDVKYNRWSATYIKVAVDNKLFTGYIDGTFKPDNSIKLEEAVTVALRLLGYSNTDFTGAYPVAQLSMYKTLGLNKNINKTQGQYVTRQDCMNLIYNLLNAKTKNGNVYATTLGCTVNASGELDYNALLSSKLEGPIVVTDNNWKSQIAIDFDSATVIRNGSAANTSGISKYDVIYYNTNINTILVYSNKIVGTYTAALPNNTSPTKATVAGNSYNLASSAAIYKMSSQGTFKYGDTVSLILDKNDEVIDVVSIANIENELCGVVTSSEKLVTTDGSVKYKVSIACTDGLVYSYEYASSYSAGDVVTVETKNDGIVIKRASVASNKSISNYSFANNIQIMDVNSYGNYAKVYPDRISDVYLSDTNILYYTLNSSSQIDRLILNNVTGDLAQYAILTGKNEINTEALMQGTYTYIINGMPNVYSLKNGNLNVAIGPIAVVKGTNDSISMSNISGVKVNSLKESYITSDNKKYLLSDNVQVYLKNISEYMLTDLDSVSDLSKFELTAYYDNYKAGKRIRIIIASQK